MIDRYRSYVLLWLVLAWLLSACTVTVTGQTTVDPGSVATPAEPAPAAEIIRQDSACSPAGATISGQVLWGAKPVPEGRVELRSGAWANPALSQVIAETVADAQTRKGRRGWCGICSTYTTTGTPF